MSTEYDDAELERLELIEALARHGFTENQGRELEADRERALATIRLAESSGSIRSIAGFVLSKFRAGYDPRSSSSSSPYASSRAPDEPEAPPTLSAIERAWSLDSDGTGFVLGLMAIAIGRSPEGLSGVLMRGWWDRELHDEWGVLIATERGGSLKV